MWKTVNRLCVFHLKTPDKNNKWIVLFLVNSKLSQSITIVIAHLTFADYFYRFFFCVASFQINFIAEYPHSSVDAVQDSKQNFATPSFRELHKVQRQVLKPAPAYVTDQTSTSGASASFIKVMPENSYEDSLPSRHSFSAGSQAQSRSKTQVFLPGEKSSCCKYLFVDNYPIM